MANPVSQIKTEEKKSVLPPSKKTPITKEKMPVYAMLYFVSLSVLDIINKSIAVKAQEIKANAAAQSPLQHILTKDLNWIQPDQNHDPATMQAYLANVNAKNKQTANEQQLIQAQQAALRQTGGELVGQASAEMGNEPQAANLINGLQEAVDDVDHAWSQMSLSNDPA